MHTAKDIQTGSDCRTRRGKRGQMTAVHRPALIGGLLLTAGLFFSPRVFAEHGMPGYSIVFAKKTPPPTNTLIPLAGGNGVPFSLKSLNAGRIRAVQIGGEDVVLLDIVESFDDMEGHSVPFPDDGGGYGENLILLSPKRPLRALATYSIQIDLDPSNDKAAPYELYRFKVGDRPKEQKPKWRHAPFLRLPTKGAVVGEDEQFGEHPALTPTIVTAVEGLGEQPGFVVVELSPLDGEGKKKHLIATIGQKDEKTGKSRCSRVAVFDHEFGVFADDTDRNLGRKYRARLTAMDISGNRMSAPSAGVDIVWNTWLRICNDPDETPGPAAGLPAPRWTGLPVHGLDADPEIDGIARYDGVLPYFERIRLPVEADTSLFAELVLTPIGLKGMRPFRYIAKLPSGSNDKLKPAKNGPRCVAADIANDNRDRLVYGPDIRWEARIQLTDPLGRRLAHKGPPLAFRLSPLRMVVCLGDAGASEVLPSPVSRNAHQSDVRWNSYPVLRQGGFTPGLLESDLLLADLSSDGPVYIRVTARNAAAKGKGKSYKLYTLLDPRGSPEGIDRHGCAKLQIDPEYPSSPERAAEIWQEISSLGNVHLEISAMDMDGHTFAAPSAVIWSRPERQLVVCVADAVRAVKSAF